MWTFIGTRTSTEVKSGKRSPRAAKLKLMALDDRALPSITFTTIDVPGAFGTEVYGINDLGQIVGAYRDSNNVNHGFLLSGGSVTTYDPPGSQGGAGGIGINNSGQISGSYGDNTRNYGFLLSGGTYTTINPPGSTQAGGNKVNNLGQVVGGYTAGGVDHGYMWDAGVYTTYDVPGSTFTGTYGINDSGQIVGFTRNPNERGFLLSGGTYNTFTVPGSLRTRASAINNSAQIVGLYAVNPNRIFGFLRTGDSYVTLDVPNSTQTEAIDINNAGQIVGTYIDATGIHGFLATVTPPNVASLVVDNGDVQRSMVRSLTVAFNQVVTVGANAFEVRLVGGAAVPFTPSVSVVNGQTVVLLTVTGGSSLADGRYTLTVRANQVTDGLGNQLDGGTDYLANFHRLYGDVNGDATVNAFDYGQFRPAFGSSTGDPTFVEWLDFDGDGTINAFDLGQFRDRFGISLP